ASIWDVFASSSGIDSMSRLPTSSTVLSITSRLRRPRKSIFNRPRSTTSHIPNCVTTSWSGPFCWSGTISVSGCAPITTPAAWIESWRTSPSSGCASSTISFAPGDREVDVHVRQVLAGRVEEALEEQAVADRVDVGDLKAVRRERAGRGAAARPYGDAVLLREADEVPDDQEVVREAHLLDRLELELEPLGELRGDAVVAAVQALLAELDEVLEGVAPVGRRVLGEQDPPQLHRDGAALGDLERPPERLLVAGEVGGHLGR